MKGVSAFVNVYYIGGFPISDELYHDDLEYMTFGRRDQNELWHYQIKGAKHGVRRFQNEDGSLTPAGRRRYNIGDPIMTSDTGTGSAGTKSKSNVAYTPSSNRSSGSNSVSPVSKAVKGATSAVSNAGKAVLNSPKVSKEYLRELNYNSKSNNFGQNSSQSNTARTQNVKNTANAGKAAADRLFGSASSALSTNSNQNGSASNQPYVSPEYQRELAYNSKQNVYPEAMTKENTVPENQITENIIPEKRITENIIPEKRIIENTIPGNETNAESQKEKKPELFDRIGNAASGALDSAKNWAGDAAKDVGNAASGALDSAKNWASGAVEDVKGLANTPFARDTANAVNGAIDKVQNAANNVADFVTGNKSRETLDKAYSDNINNGGNGSSPELDRARDAYNKTLPGMVEKAVDVTRENVIPGIQEKVGNAAKDVGDFAKSVKDTFSDGSKEREELSSARADMKNYKDDPEFISEFSKRYPEEAQQYLDEQKAAKERLEKAEKSYMDFSNNPVNTVARALNLPNNKGNWAFAVPGNEQYLQTMERGFIPKTDNIADWFTGNNYKRTADKYDAYAADYDALANQAYEYAREAERNGNPSQAQWFKDEGDYVKNVYGQEDRDVANANMNLYNNAPRQKIINAASNVAEWGSEAVDSGKRALERLFGKKK